MCKGFLWTGFVCKRLATVMLFSTLALPDTSFHMTFIKSQLCPRGRALPPSRCASFFNGMFCLSSVITYSCARCWVMMHDSRCNNLGKITRYRLGHVFWMTKSKKKVPLNVKYCRKFERRATGSWPSKLIEVQNLFLSAIWFIFCNLPWKEKQDRAAVARWCLTVVL